MALKYCLVSFHYSLQDSLEHFLQGRSSTHKLPQLLFTWECFEFFLNYEGQFCQIQESWLTVFSFSFVNILAHCLLTSKVSDKNHTVLSRISCIWWFSPLVAFKTCSSSLFFEYLIIMCLVYVSWVPLTSSMVSFLYVYMHAFHQIWDLFKPHFFILWLFLTVLLGHPQWLLLVHLMVSQRPIMVCSFFFNLFPFCSLGLVISIVLYSSSLILSSGLLKSAFEFL